MAGSLPRNHGNKSVNRTGALVSRRLRNAGWTISPGARKHRMDGMFVSQHGDSITVLVDLGGGPARNRDVADQVATEVGTWAKSDNVSTVLLGGGAVHVYFTYGR
jgi:hypothetical protein